MSTFTRATALRRDNPFQQFGQTNDEATNGGSTGCTDTVLQFIAKYGKNQWYTHNRIRAIVHHTNRFKGLNYAEVQTFFRAVGLPYLVKLGMSASDMLELSRRGPLLIGVMYEWVPEWYGYHYNGRTADGEPNGFASPRGHAGKTQLGLNLRHAACLLGEDNNLGVAVMEPNHGSPARPERPPYDLMTRTQFREMVASYQRATGRTYCAYPTRTL